VAEQVPFFIDDKAGFTGGEPRVTGKHESVKHVSSFSHKGFSIFVHDDDGWALRSIAPPSGRCKRVGKRCLTACEQRLCSSIGE